MRVLLPALFVVFSASAAWGDCAPRPFEEAFDQADAIFIGRARSVVRLEHERADVTFDVFDSWKPAPATVELSISHSCNDDYVEANRDYLVFAQRKPNGRFAPLTCGYFRTAESSFNTISVLDWKAPRIRREPQWHVSAWAALFSAVFAFALRRRRVGRSMQLLALALAGSTAIVWFFERPLPAYDVAPLKAPQVERTPLPTIHARASWPFAMASSARFSADSQTIWVGQRDGLVSIPIASPVEGGLSQLQHPLEHRVEAVLETRTHKLFVVHGHDLEMREADSLNVIDSVAMSDSFEPEIAVSGDESIVYKDGRQLFEWTPHSPPRLLLNLLGSHPLALSGDGKRVAVLRTERGSHGRWVGLVTVMEVKTGQEIARFVDDWPTYRGVTLDQTGDRLMIRSEDGVRVFDTESKQLLIAAPSEVSLAQLSPGGRWATSGVRDQFLIWDLNAKAPFRSLAVTRRPVAFSPNGQFLALMSPDHDWRHEVLELIALW